MFHNLPEAFVARMRTLETRDAEQRQQGLPKTQRYCQVPPETGRFLALLCASAPPGPVLEIGTSAGYSTLWLLQACRLSGRSLTTVELLESKRAIAAETFALTGVAAEVEQRAGDAREVARDLEGLAFCFIDAEKPEYPAYYELCLERSLPGALLVCDNITSHAEHLQDFTAKVLADTRVDALLVPLGKGLLVCRNL